MKTTIAILTLSIASALAQAPKPGTAVRPQVAAVRPQVAADPAKPKIVPDILDLKPSIVQYEEDGLFLPKICLTGTKARVLFAEPNGFTLIKDASVFTLQAKADRTATVNILSSAQPLLPLTEEARRKAVRDSILATAPKEADRVEIITESENPVPINGWKTYQFTMSYGLFGQTFKKQVVFVQLHPYQELQFIAHAPDKLFPSTTAAMSAILHTWYREPNSFHTASATKSVERD